MKAAVKPSGNRFQEATKPITTIAQTARKAVVEGQGMVVYVDYVYRPYGTQSGGYARIDLLDGRACGEGRADSQMMHDAPMIMREVGNIRLQRGPDL